MPERSYDRADIALDQLETGLRLWESGGDDLSVITLAGAAEEILGKCLKAEGRSNSLDDMKTAYAKLSMHLFGEQPGPRELAERANRARNLLKHYALGSSPTVTLDAHQEAGDMLNRAIDNYWDLNTSLTPGMRRFLEARHHPGGSDC